MTPFARILKEATIRAGGADALRRRLPVPLNADALRARPDDRYLSLMSLRVFRAGLKHSLVDAKWPAFEEAFHGFRPERIRAMSDDDLDALMRDARLIRHWGKVKAVRANAAALCAIAEEKGGFGAYLAAWPSAEIVALWEDLAKRFQQLGGNSAPSFLRMAGKDTFLLTGDVVRALKEWARLDVAPASKKDRRAAGALVSRWAEEGKRPLCQVSVILALSVD